MKSFICILNLCSILFTTSTGCLSNYQLRTPIAHRPSSIVSVRNGEPPPSHPSHPPSTGIVSNFIPRMNYHHNSETSTKDGLIRFSSNDLVEEMSSTGANSQLSIDIGGGGLNKTGRFVRVRNEGDEDEFIQMTAFNQAGQSVSIYPYQFELSSGSMKEIPFTLSPVEVQTMTTYKSFEASPPSSSELITIQARGKRNSVQRSFNFAHPVYEGAGGSAEFEPFCFDKDVTGTCRYRSDPAECFRFHWTAYATILNQGGGGQSISSIPEGLFLSSGDHGRVRVYLKISCCTPIVQFISTDPYYQRGVNSCVIDVRELQYLHPGEIAGIAVAAVLLVLIIIIVLIVCLRRRGRETINVGMLPRTDRSRNRSTEIISRQ